jgi:hypothetical protein
MRACTRRIDSLAWQALFFRRANRPTLAPAFVRLQIGLTSDYFGTMPRRRPGEKVLAGQNVSVTDLFGRQWEKQPNALWPPFSDMI